MVQVWGITILSASTLAMASAQRPLKTESCASVPLGHQGAGPHHGGEGWALCTCGNNGCLEAVASGRAIAQQARNLISSGVKTRILELAGGNIERVEAKTVFAAAREQDVAALDLVRRAGEYIGIGIASYINLLDPEKIVLGRRNVK